MLCHPVSIFLIIWKIPILGANSQHQRNMHGHLATDETGGWGIQGHIVYFFCILGHTVMLLERKITEKNIILLKKKMYCLVAGLPS